MAEFDFGSLASSVLPAALGFALGSPALGVYGASAGLGRTLDRRLEVDKLNTDIAFKNQQRAMERQRIDQHREYQEKSLDLEERKLTAEQERWARADRAAAIAMRLNEAQLADLDRKTQKALSEEKAFDELVKAIPPDQQVLAKSDPEGFLKTYRQRELEKGSRERLVPVLKSLNIPGAEALAESGDFKTVTDLIGDLAKIRATPRQGSYDLKAVGDAVYLLDNHSGAFKPTNIKPGKDRDDLMTAHQIMTEARQQVEAPFKTGPMGAIDMSKLGKTPQETAANFQAMINKRARELAAERGVSQLFQANPQDRLAERLQSGSITSSSGAVAYLLSQGIPEDQAKQMAAEIIRQSKGGGKAGAEY
jgi:hypothetical protein